MANQWFKLYGVEMLADPKFQRLNAGERSMWITLLCLASMDNGVIKHCEEAYLITHSGIDPMDINKYLGTLVKFEMLGFITIKRDNIGMEIIEIKNWQKRQEVYSESRDRVKKWREKQRDFDNDDNVTDVTLPSNARREEKRIEKKRIEPVPYSEIFERFWAVYPEKVGKGKAYESWKKLSLEVQEECIQAIQNQSNANHFRGRDGVDYIPHPTTWLNQKRWEDGIKVHAEIIKPKYIDLTKKM